MKGARLMLALTILGACDACRRELPPEPPIVIVVTDAGAYDEPFDLPNGYMNERCARACANLQGRRCPDGFKRPGEDSCYVVCKRAEGTGKIDFNLDCIIDAGNQDAVRKCGTYRCE